ncbi:MAG: VWA domain-containing protein [Sedimentisphaerales bacterium]|nr:VWA domain-containing protein [Sedimentisphaerales bacterium]
MHLGNEDILWLLWLLPVLVGLYVYAFYRKRRAMRVFADTPTLARLDNPQVHRRQYLKALLLIAAAAALIIALTQPAWNPHPEEIAYKGRDIVVLLDVSRSMLAEDIKPNRLERAKLAVEDLLGALNGERIALVAFAGHAVVKCPLTHDYGFARMALSEIDTTSVSRGGSAIGDAVRLALDDVFDEQQRDFQDIILITDGEDHETLPLEAAQRAGQQGVRIFAIGLGDAGGGSLIPDNTAQGHQMYRGEPVRTSLNAELLRDMVFATPGGMFLNVGTGDFDLVDVYHNLIAGAAKRQMEATTVIRYDEKFQLFLALGLVLLVFEALIRERVK